MKQISLCLKKIRRKVNSNDHIYNPIRKMNFRDVIRYIITTSNDQTKHELETKVALRPVLGMHSNEYTQRRFDLLIVFTDSNR